MKRLYSVFDDKSATFTDPFVAITKGVAARWFLDSCEDERIPMSKHPEDYTLFDLGEWDEEKGVVHAWPSPVPVVNGKLALAMKDRDRTAASEFMDDDKPEDEFDKGDQR